MCDVAQQRAEEETRRREEETHRREEETRRREEAEQEIALAPRRARAPQAARRRPAETDLPGPTLATSLPPSCVSTVT